MWSSVEIMEIEAGVWCFSPQKSKWIITESIAQRSFVMESRPDAARCVF